MWAKVVSLDVDHIGGFRAFLRWGIILKETIP
jgi:hypothetical protein